MTKLSPLHYRVFHSTAACMKTSGESHPCM